MQFVIVLGDCAKDRVAICDDVADFLGDAGEKRRRVGERAVGREDQHVSEHAHGNHAELLGGF